MLPDKLKIGQPYFQVAYDDERMTRIVIRSYEYLGSGEFTDRKEASYRFRPMNPFEMIDEDPVEPIKRSIPYDGEMFFDVANLKGLVDVTGLIVELQGLEIDGSDS